MPAQKGDGTREEYDVNVPSPSLEDRYAGCLLGGAIGDALGSPIEGLTPDEIFARHGGWVTTFVPPAVSRRDDRHKGDGNVSDDTLMTIALCRAYLAKGAQLEAHDMATYFMAEFAEKPMWVPEFGREMLLLDRVFLPEKQLFLRLKLLDISPREAGQGNMVNCGAAMYAAPVGLMNAADPDGAYHRAIDLFSAHQTSFGLEAAGVMAACVAEALRPRATVETIVEVALRLAKDGTRNAIEAVIGTAVELPDQDRRASYRQLRVAMEPFDTRKGDVRRYVRTGTYPSQHHAIEELPLALGFLLIGKGDFRETMVQAVNYGRDSDSIAGMAGAMLGALIGKSALPQEWTEEIVLRNRIDFVGVAADLLGLFAADYRLARARAYRREDELRTLLADLGEGEGE